MRKCVLRKDSQEDSGITSTRKRPSLMRVSGAPADVVTLRVGACYACRFTLVQGLLPEAAEAERDVYWGEGARILALRVGTMRLGSGTFAACCVVIEVLGVALFLRGFFPAPVRSSSRTEHQAEPPAPEPSAGTDPSPAVSAPLPLIFARGSL